MRFEDLSREDQHLLQTDLGEFDKVAADQVGLIGEMYSTGFNKLAAETADWLDKLAEEEEEEEEEKNVDHEGEKTAAACGAWTERGFFDGLRKLGSDRYGDEGHYLVPFILEKIGAEAAEAAKTAAEETLFGKTKRKAGEYWDATGKSVKGYGDKIKGNWAGMAAKNSKGEHVKALERASHAGALGLRVGGPIVGAGALAYGAKKLNDRRKAKKLEKQGGASSRLADLIARHPGKTLALEGALIGGATYAGATNKARESQGAQAESSGKIINDAVKARKNNFGQYLLNPSVPGPLSEAGHRLKRRHNAAHQDSPYLTQLVPGYGMITGGKAGKKEMEQG